MNQTFLSDSVFISHYIILKCSVKQNWLSQFCFVAKLRISTHTKVTAEPRGLLLVGAENSCQSSPKLNLMQILHRKIFFSTANPSGEMELCSDSYCNGWILPVNFLKTDRSFRMMEMLTRPPVFNKLFDF